MLATVIKKSTYKHGYLFLVAAWLYTISFAFTNYWSYNSSPQNVKNTLERYVATQENSFKEVLKDTAYLNAMLVKHSRAADEKMQEKSYGLFAYTFNDIGNPIQAFWNTIEMSVSIEDIKRADGDYVVNYQNGIFELLKRTITIKNKTCVVAALVPLHWQYFLENKYLSSKFASVERISSLYKITYDSNQYPIKNSRGQTLFYIARTANADSEKPDTISVTLRIVTILLLLAFFNNVARDICTKYSFFKGLYFLAFALCLFRLLISFTSFPFYLNTLDIFVLPKGSNRVTNTSLGDLLVNAIFFFQIITYVFFNRKHAAMPKQKETRFLSIAALAIFSWFTLGICDVVRDMLYNSNASFDVNNFFGLNIYTVIGLIILSMMILCYYYFSWLLVLPSIKAGMQLPTRMAIVAAAGLFYVSIDARSPLIEMKLAAIVWLCVYMALLQFRLKDRHLPIIKSSFFVFWIISFTAAISAILLFIKKDYELETRKNVAVQLAAQIDPYSEDVLKIATTGLTPAFLEGNFSRLQNEETNKHIKDSLISANFSGYLNKYETRIYTYDGNLLPLFNEDQTSYYTIDNIVQNLPANQRSENIKGLYFLENTSASFSYIYKTDIVSKDSGFLGHIAVTVIPKKYKTDAIYPELFRQANDLQTDINRYSFAIYKNRDLINYSSDYPFSDSLQTSTLPMLQYEERTRDGYNELWYKTTDNKVVLIVSKNTLLVEYLTLFATLFCITIIIILCYNLGIFLLRTRLNKSNIFPPFYLNIRSQVQATIVLISLFSFIVIGVATVSFFIARYNSATEEKLSKTIQIIINEIQDATRSEIVLNDTSNIGNNTDLDRKIVEIANLNNTDVNFYDIYGNLNVSTQPYIYNKQVLSNKMHPEAFYNLHDLGNISFTQKEYIKSFSFISIYAPVKSENGDTIAYLNIPYLRSQTEINQEISNLLVTLINLNALIFVMSGIVALLLTKRITSSLELIGNKMRVLHFGEKNEQIKWDKKDEIGVLVNQYNKMVRQLEDSAVALARSERAGAWQEMARQVAHEIKNPLTPMKLSIQYLQRAISSNAPNVKELSERMADTLVEQIDQLAKIAGDFSQFSNINNATPEAVNITDVLQSLYTLHLAGSDSHIKYVAPQDDIYINADRTQIQRLFTNLVKNAEEAALPDEVAHVTIEAYTKNSNVIVTIADKGTGIPQDKQHRIFEPNFTTKSSGTGLGLAICKGIVEKAGGKLWFTTELNKGTKFYVELPLYL